MSPWSGVALQPLLLVYYLSCSKGFVGTGRNTGLPRMTSWPPFGKCSWSSDSLVSISVSQALVYIFPVPLDLHEHCAFIVHSFSFCPVHSPFEPCPTLHIITLSRKTFLRMLTQCLGQSQQLSSPRPPCHLLAAVGITAEAPFFYRMVSAWFRDLLPWQHNGLCPALSRHSLYVCE